MEAKGVGLAVATNWIFSGIIGGVFPIMADPSGLGMPITFLIFSGFCGLTFLFVLLFVVETKGLTWEEIQKKLIGKNK